MEEHRTHILPLTSVGQALLSYLTTDAGCLDEIWLHGDEAGIVGTIFTQAARKKFGSSPKLKDISDYIAWKRQVDPAIDVFAAEAAIRVSLDQIEVLEGLPEGQLALGMTCMVRHLVSDTCPKSQLAACVINAEREFAKIMQSGVPGRLVG